MLKFCLGEGCPFSSILPNLYKLAKELVLHVSAKNRIFYFSFFLFPCGRTPSNTPDVSKPLTLPFWRNEERKDELSNQWCSRKEAGYKALLLIPHRRPAGIQLACAICHSVGRSQETPLANNPKASFSKSSKEMRFRKTWGKEIGPGIKLPDSESQLHHLLCDLG